MTVEIITQIIHDLLVDKKAIDVEVINLEGKTILADRFIIASGTSITHNKALSDEVELAMKSIHGISPNHIEGYNSARWILMDYGDVIVHILHTEERQFYSLEKLWQGTGRNTKQQLSS